MPALRTLPVGPRATRVRASGCAALTSLPARLRLWALDLPSETPLESLPSDLHVEFRLDLSLCTRLRLLPEGLSAGTPIRWRGVPVDARIAFQPETITASKALAERNLERRRVLIERMGNERFLKDAKAEVLDQDRDPGGERQLLKVPLPGDEDLVCVAVTCPSTGRRYVIRVPPAMRTCRQAVAWVAGFDDPSQYRPIVET